MKFVFLQDEIDKDITCRRRLKQTSLYPEGRLYFKPLTGLGRRDKIPTPLTPGLSSPWTDSSVSLTRCPDPVRVTLCPL